MGPEHRYEALDVEVLAPSALVPSVELTVAATLDLGFRLTYVVPLTLVGLDPMDPATSEFRRAVRLIDQRVRDAEHIWVSTVEHLDVPSRWSCVLYADESNVNVELVKSGLVTAYDGGGSGTA